MATVQVREGDLRAAMRDRRYWQPGHLERAAYSDWVTEGWQRLHGPEATVEGGARVVQVRAYDRVRNGRREQVESYTQRRRGAQGGEGGGAGQQAPRPAAPEPVPAPQQAPARRTLIVFVGGLFDGTSGLVGRVFTRAGGEGLTGTQVEYASHDQPARIRSLIQAVPVGTRIVLVGHSWGADTAAQIVDRQGREGSQIDMLVTIDPVGRGLSEDFFRRVRAGAREWINVNAADRDPSNPSNQVAEAGGQYGRRPARFASQHFDAPFAHGDFGLMVDRTRPDGRTTLYERIMGR